MPWARGPTRSSPPPRASTPSSFSLNNNFFSAINVHQGLPTNARLFQILALVRGHAQQPLTVVLNRRHLVPSQAMLVKVPAVNGIEQQFLLVEDARAFSLNGERVSRTPTAEKKKQRKKGEDAPSQEELSGQCCFWDPSLWGILGKVFKDKPLLIDMLRCLDSIYL